MAIVVKVVEVLVNQNSETFSADMGTALTSAILALGAPFTTSFDIVNLQFENAGRSAMPTEAIDTPSGVKNVQPSPGSFPRVRVRATVQA